MNIIEVIQKRRSCRAFKPEPFRAEDKQALETFIRENRRGLTDETIDLVITEKGLNEKKMKLNYGLIQGQNTYILGRSKVSPASRVSYGYLLEKVVLKATEMNLSTCWVGYFDSEYFPEIPIEKGFEIPGIVIIGYSTERETWSDKFVRFTIKASSRQPWEKLFFLHPSKTPLTPEIVQEYSDCLEMVRLAPSSGNTQTWRVCFDAEASEFHFYKKPISKKYEEKGLHDIDLGIALSHFELTAVFKGLSGRWVHLAKPTDEPIEDLHYIMTWKAV